MISHGYVLMVSIVNNSMMKQILFPNKTRIKIGSDINMCTIHVRFMEAQKTDTQCQ